MVVPYNDIPNDGKPPPPPPSITILPSPNIEFPLMVLILVPDTKVSCLAETSSLVARSVKAALVI